MKFLALLALVSTALATPLALYDSAQSPLGGDVLPTQYPGFDLDLNELRLVQLEGHEDPVVMTELEKVYTPSTCIRLRVSAVCRHSDSGQGSGHQVLRCVSLPPVFSEARLIRPARTETLDLGSRAQFRTATKRVLPVARSRPCADWRSSASYPKPSHNESVRSVIGSLEIQNLRDGLEKFTSFRTRCEY